ncbi:hypothetical protein D9M72_482470 [compost metagenome]
MLDAVGDEARDVLAHQHRPLAGEPQRGHHASHGVFGGGVVAHDFHQRDDVGGGEEVGAHEAVAPHDGAGDGVDGQARGIGGEEGGRGAEGVELGENAALELQVFRHGLDHQVAVAGRFQPGRDLNALHRFLDPAGGVDVQLAVYRLERAFQGAFHRVDQDDVQSLRGEQRGDAAAHGACADDGEILEGSIHDGSLGADMPGLRAGTCGTRMLSVSSGVPFCAPGQKNRFVLYANICAYIEFLEEIVLKVAGGGQIEDFGCSSGGRESRCPQGQVSDTREASEQHEVRFVRVSDTYLGARCLTPVRDGAATQWDLPGCLTPR